MDTSTTPAPGIIPEGPASENAKLVTALLAVISIVTTVLEGDHSTETLLTAGGALVTFLTYLLGRYAQATAREKAGTPDLSVSATVTDSAPTPPAGGPRQRVMPVKAGRPVDINQPTGE